ncbi:MAG: hypothetical protein ABR562_04815 [Thermoplasmatota archaeon]
MRGAWLALVAVACLASGCVSVENYCLRPNLTAHAVAAAATPEGGNGGIAMTIRVTDVTTGTPVTNAAVRAYWPVSPHDNGDTVTYIPLLLSVDVTKHEPATAATLMYVDLHTGAGGAALLHVPAGARVTAVATADGFTMESAHLGAEPGVPALTIGLHRSTLVVSRDETITDVTATFGYVDHGEDVKWLPVALPWTGDAGVSRNYTMRMVELTATLEWANAPPTRSDMGIGLGLEPPTMLVYRNAHDEMTSLSAGSESVTLTLKDFEDLGTVGKETIYAGATYDAMVAPLGMSTNLTLRGRFDTETLANKYCAQEYRGVQSIVDADGAAAPAAVQAPKGKPASTGDDAGSAGPVGAAAAHPSTGSATGVDARATPLPGLAVALLALGAAVASRRR